MTAIVSTMTKTGATRAGVWLLVLVSLLWAAMETVILQIPGHYSLYEVVWVRYGTHLLLMVLVFGPLRGMQLVRTRHLGLQIARAAMMLIMPVSFILATDYHCMPVQNIMTIFWLAPLMSTALAMILLHEHATRASWIASAAGLVLIAVLTHPSSDVTVAGVLLSLAMGLSFSLYPVMTRMLDGESALTNLFYTGLGVFVPLSFALPRFWQPLTLQAGLMMSLVGLLGFLALWVWEAALDAAAVSTLAPVFFLEPVFMLILSLIARALHVA